jgi:cyclic beta-1,2-glucan synthetase
LLFANGTGGFTPDGREYLLLVPPAGPPSFASSHRGREEGAVGPPAPWCNVVANPACGFLVSEGGGGYTWAGNSQSNRLTPWSNDPVSDPPGEAVYLRDEESGAVWSPTPLPVPPAAPTLVRHGQGYTTFSRTEQGLGHELTLFVPPDDPVKVFLLKVTNRSSTVRRLSTTFYAEWVLGTTRDQMAPYTVTEIDPDGGALLACNSFNTDFGAAVAFAAVSLRPYTLTGDRAEFLGRNRGPAAPDALGRAHLSGRVGPGLDPCAALQGAFVLRPGESREIVFLLGQAGDRAGVRPLVQRYLQPEQARAALRKVVARWDEVLGAVQVKTPSPQLDVLLNRWLLYQVLSCRLWGRSAFYQSGGAYGFRDQLQDVMALVHALPAEARKQIVRSAGRQFPEGDVQHWWHPPAGRGVRTRISDDYLWLPFVVHHYVLATGDRTVLDESTAFLKYPPLKPEEEETYGLPEVSEEKATVFEHCLRALEHGWQLGAHGLPLMGTGDWNDGMNKVGAGGKGESVWVGWFLLMNYRHFAALVEERGDAGRAARFRERAEQLHKAVEEHAWDGAWYRRAYFDDGTPLGSAQNVECQIDSLTQTWAVFSGVADPARAGQAMAAVFDRLVRRDDRLILLFDPPFDNGPAQPGYIKGYVPGIRENGGQYTHAAVWVVQAAALLGRGGLAMELLDLLNPVRHAESSREVECYKVEPFVLAGDVYGRPPHAGRGGWTWYTGAAGWLYRAGLETLLGVRREGNRLLFAPRIPKDWKGYTVTYRHGPTVYRINVANPHGLEAGTVRVWLDGAELSGDSVPLADDGRKTHEVRVELRLS